MFTVGVTFDSDLDDYDFVFTWHLCRIVEV